jgi:hypothetical protein
VGIAGSCFMSGSAVLISDCYANRLFNPKVDRMSGYRTKNMLCIPIHGVVEEEAEEVESTSTSTKKTRKKIKKNKIRTTQVNLGCLQVINKLRPADHKRRGSVVLRPIKTFRDDCNKDEHQRGRQVKEKIKILAR